MTLSRSNPRAKQRWSLLVAGLASMMLLATAVLGVAIIDGTTPPDDCDIQIETSAGGDSCVTDAGACRGGHTTMRRIPVAAVKHTATRRT